MAAPVSSPGTTAAEADVKEMWQGEMDEMKAGEDETDGFALTERHIVAIRRYFDHFDSDDSGFIEIGELAHLAAALGDSLTRRELDEAFTELDGNGNGKISFQEFIR